MNHKRLFIIVITLLFFSCNSKIEVEKYNQIQKKGYEISGQTQAVLLANVGQAIQTGGSLYAVEFCNLKASPIVDSLNESNNCFISRISVKNRNPENILKTKTDEALWSIFEKGTLKDTVIYESKKFIYYRPIKTALPACLKCHGEPGTDIEGATLKKIQHLYPADLATGYKLNDFRGLWKIEFPAD